MAKRLLCVILSLLMIIAVLPTGVVADDSIDLNTYLNSSHALTSGSYYLSSNITLTSAITIAAGEEVTIDFKSYTITSTSISSVFKISGDLTITSTSSSAGVTFTGGSSSSLTYTIFDLCADGSSLTISSGTYTATQYAYVVKSTYSGSTVNINGGTLSSHIAAVYFSGSGSELNITSGTLTQANNSSYTVSNMGAVYVTGGDSTTVVSISGGTLKAGSSKSSVNTANLYANAFCGTINITNGTFSPVFTITSYTVPAIRASGSSTTGNCTLNISGGTFSSNNQIMVGDYCDLKITGGTFSPKSTSSYAIYITGENSSTTISGGLFTSSSANGVIYQNESTSSLRISGGFFEDSSSNCTSILNYTAGTYHITGGYYYSAGSSDESIISGYVSDPYGTTTVTGVSGGTSSSYTYVAVVAAQTIYTVTYDANGGSGTVFDDTAYYGTGTTATATVLSGASLTLDNYRFKCWNTESGGGGTDYHENDTIELSDNLTLYAIWELMPVAQNNTTGEEYTDLQSAIDAATAGDTITVLRDFEVSATITVSTNLTLDLSDYTITSTATGDQAITASSDLTITGDSGGITATASYIIINNGKYTLNINGGTFTDSNGVIKNTAGGTVNITGGTIKTTGNVAYTKNNSVVNISGGSITSTGRAFYVENSTINVTGGQISGTTCVVRIGTGGTFNISGGSISSTQRVFWFAGDGTACITGGYISGTSNLVVIYSGTPEVTISGGYFDSEPSSDYIVTDYEAVELDSSDSAYSDGYRYKVVYTLPTFYGKNILLGGTIGVKFYVDFGDYVDESNYSNYKVVFNLNNDDTTVTYSEATQYDGTIYYFTLDVPCWLMGSTITAQIYNGDAAVGNAIVYSVAKYVSNVSSSSTPNMQSLLTYMLNFGYYAEDYYNYVNSASITSLDDSVTQSLDSVTVDVLSDYNVSASVSTIEVSAAVVLDTTCEIRVYVPTGDYTVIIDGETRTETSGTDSTGTYYAISNILVQDWENGHSIVVKNSSEEVVYSVSGYNVLSYAYTVVNNSGSYDSSVVNLVKAMYLYNDAADRYLGNKT